MDSRVYTKRQIDRMLSTFTPKQAKYELQIVPKELAKKVEIELDDGFVIARTENIISIRHNFTSKYIINQLEKYAPEFMCAAENTCLDEIPLIQIIDETKNPPIFRSAFQNANEGCFSL